MINIIFMGTPQIAVKTLCHLSEKTNDTKVLAVVTPPDKPQGRKLVITPPPVKVAAEKNSIPVYQTKSIRKDENLINNLRNLNPDFFVTFAFGQILSQEVLDIPKFGTVNVHASLLPKYRGANPIQHAIINGDKKTGITTMLTSLGMDEGDICLKEEIEITENMTDSELREEIAEKAPDILYKSIKKLYNNELTPIKQNSAEATYAGKFKKEDGKINLDDTAINIHNKGRGMLSWPTCYFEYKGKKVRVTSTEVSNLGQRYEQGTIAQISKKGLSVGTKNGCLVLKEVQPESKNKMPAYAWNNSVHLKIGDKLC